MKSFAQNLLIILSAIFFAFPSLTINAQPLDELLNRGDQFTEEFDNQKALDVYLKANSLYPDNWEVLWRISRAYVDIAEHMPTNTSKEQDAQLEIYQKAFDFADKSVKLAPNQSITYLRRAIANGRIALFKGVFSVAGVVNTVKADCEKAIELGNGGNYFQALAHYVLGRTHAKTSEKWKPARAVLGLGWADIDIAITEYKKAIQLYPDFKMFYLDLAHAYIREDEYAKAKDMLNKTISAPIKDEDDEDRDKEAKKLLSEIKNK
jgi:tetratricopeptide (TPR) repeat protein